MLNRNAIEIQETVFSFFFKQRFSSYFAILIMLKRLLWFGFNYISFYGQIQLYIGKLGNLVECLLVFISKGYVSNECAFVKFSLRVSRDVEGMKNVITAVW